MRYALLALLLISVAGCGTWPDVESPMGRQANGAWPTLLPTSELLSGVETDTDEDADTARLLARADALRRKAALLRSSVTTDAEFDALRARLAR